MALQLGCIADDLTGATDVASVLVREGLRTTLAVGVPDEGALRGVSGAAVVALKSRTSPVADALEQSLAALARLKDAGARQILFKYCSTFDSTDRGNIGPVADALLDAIGETLTIVCPAYPRNRRTIYRGNLFVGDEMLSESPMRNHPLTPMTDSNLVRLMSRQSSRKVGLIDYDTVRQGAAAIRVALERLRAAGTGHVVLDATEDAHLIEIAEATRDLGLLTGGAGVALGLPRVHGAAGATADDRDGTRFDWPAGPAAILAGSCSVATLEQVERAATHYPSRQLDPIELVKNPAHAEALARWACEQADNRPVLIHAGQPADAIVRIQQTLGRARAGELVEHAFGQIASILVAKGFRRILVAGGETAGAVVGALGVRVLQIGPEIAPGVPWTLTHREPTIALALKSGNFGGPDFFTDAMRMLP
jgi:uncharacterized protein YgbK (DUF1537 family)